MQKYQRFIAGLAFVVQGAAAAPATEPLESVVERLTATPIIKAEPGFSARILVPPGQLYDPLVMLRVGDVMWLNDDGGEEGEKGSRLLSVDAQGGIKALADIGKLLPTVGFDVAPAGFGPHGGQIFTLAQPKVAMAGGLANHLVVRVDPTQDFTSTVTCTLPEAGPKKKAGFGLDARFGPPGSPFANRLFVITILNNAIYEVTPAGQCTPFVVFDGERYSAPTLMTFTPDGQHMLVTVSQGAFDITSTTAPQGAILSVAPDGKIDDKPVYAGAGRPMGMAYAPPGFGAYAGQLFFADIGLFEVPVPMTQALRADGRIYRLTPTGEVALVASGLHNPIGVNFFDNRLWVTDINGDFIAGKRELPDGFMVELEAD